ncbi:MAG: isochorismatase family protein [Candidatus Heimdallarchaeota archaeon]|nr:isochorismatase family protein [Candidatus Heimdallarchaeota archaeon]
MSEKTIIEEWFNVETPPPPEIKEVIINPDFTALLILDIQMNNCNEERRPRCVESVPKIKGLLDLARLKKMFIVYALTNSATKENIRSEVQPIATEPIVQSGVDKFYKTNLEELLEKKGIKQVIIVGTSAHGAVLNTATGAAARQLEIIIPIDCLSASHPYAEQYTIWHLVNSPGTRRNVILTKAELIKI